MRSHPRGRKWSGSEETEDEAKGRQPVIVCLRTMKVNKKQRCTTKSIMCLKIENIAEQVSTPYHFVFLNGISWVGLGLNPLERPTLAGRPGIGTARKL